MNDTPAIEAAESIIDEYPILLPRKDNSYYKSDRAERIASIAAIISRHGLSGGEDAYRRGVEAAAKVADEIAADKLEARSRQYKHEIAWAYEDIGNRTAEEIAILIRALIPPAEVNNGNK